ncbi:glutathione-disulfide reductase, partial [bacterium CPR1]|nr:glutathione-disulfide reductase [bacterium CPR1]
GMIAAGGVLEVDRDLGLEQAGVELRSDGSIVVNHLYQTSVPSIHAVGDCTGHIQLTPVAVAEGRALAETLFNDNPTTVPYDVLPTAVFSQPAVGTVGLTEAQARERYGEVDVYRTVFRPMKYPIAGGEEKVLLKLVVERASDRVVGCHIVANEGPELAQVLGVALRAGASKRDFDTTIALHPTLAEELVLLRERV